MPSCESPHRCTNSPTSLHRDPHVDVTDKFNMDLLSALTLRSCPNSFLAMPDKPTRCSNHFYKDTCAWATRTVLTFEQAPSLIVSNGIGSAQLRCKKKPYSRQVFHEVYRHERCMCRRTCTLFEFIVKPSKPLVSGGTGDDIWDSISICRGAHLK